MIGTRHEEYGNLTDGVPFVLHTDLRRSLFQSSRENNWHDDLEIQLCLDGAGTVLMNGEKHAFQKNDIAVVNANVIHYTSTETELTYACLIVSADFCRKMGFAQTVFHPLVQCEKCTELFYRLLKIYTDDGAAYRIAKLNRALLDLLIHLSEQHAACETPTVAHRDMDTIKTAIVFIRENYSRKLKLEEIATAAECDKYALCRKFKKLTTQTVMQNLNHYRCLQAIEHIKAGETVAQAAYRCGFENLSFFTKTCKKYMGRLPSSYK